MGGAILVEKNKKYIIICTIFIDLENNIHLKTQSAEQLLLIKYLL